MTLKQTATAAITETKRRQPTNRLGGKELLAQVTSNAQSKGQKPSSVRRGFLLCCDNFTFAVTMSIFCLPSPTKRFQPHFVRPDHIRKEFNG